MEIQSHIRVSNRYSVDYGASSLPQTDYLKPVVVYLLTEALDDHLYIVTQKVKDLCFVMCVWRKGHGNFGLYHHQSHHHHHTHSCTGVYHSLSCLDVFAWNTGPHILHITTSGMQKIVCHVQMSLSIAPVVVFCCITPPLLMVSANLAFTYMFPIGLLYRHWKWATMVMP